MKSIDCLFSYEFCELLEALRRDMRAELTNAVLHPHMSEVHLRNARYALRLLEALNPRGPWRNEKTILRSAA